MAQDKTLQSLKDEVCRKYGCHTVILYGSRARGEATISSDYDVLGIRARGKNLRDARPWKGSYLDIFVYPERKLKRVGAESMRFRGGRVLVQKGHFGSNLLARLNRAYARGPKPLAPDEIQARKIWARKMLGRMRTDNVEAHYRRVWLLTALLEDYFVFRDLWYEGPKASLKWLKENEPKIHARFAKALKPGSDISAIEALIRAAA